ncbi:hypothetical protein ABTE00_21560, partial [Acinetobacter baumannii]
DERLLFGGAVALIAGAVAIWYGRPEWFELHRLVGLAVLIGCGLTLIEGRANLRLLLLSVAALAISFVMFFILQRGMFDLPALP